MKDRLLEFLKAENKSSAQFAEEIGVQASGISHIISGRNNPSLDFVLKMLDKYKYLSTDWLLFGRGSMYKDAKMTSLFDEKPEVDLRTGKAVEENTSGISDIDIQQVKDEKLTIKSMGIEKDTSLKVVRIVWFLNNNTFEEYYPH